MHFAARDRQTAQRARVVLLRFQYMEHALAHGRHRADVSDLLSFDRFQHFLGVETFMQDHRAAEIDDAESERAAGVEVDRRRQYRLIVRAEAFLDSVVDAVENESPLCRQAAFGKAGGSRRQHHDKWIAFLGVHIRLIRALTVKQTAVTEIGR